MSSLHPAAPDSAHAEVLEPRSALARLARAWDQFFFRPADPTTLGLVRICCGLVAVYTIAAFSLDLQNFFGRHGWIDLQLRNEWRAHFPTVKGQWTWEQLGPEDPDYRWGVPPEKTHTEGSPIWSIWFHVTDPTAMAAVHTAIIVVAVLFTLGLCTRLTSALTWFAMLSYIHRSNNSVFGVDTMMSIALLYLMIGPSGAALSLDRLIQRWWATYRALRPQRLAGESTAEVGAPAATVPPLPVTPSVSANLAIRLLQIHVCIIYLAAGLSKLQGSSWWTGEAIWGTLANFEFAPMQYDLYSAFLLFLCSQVWLFELFMTIGTLFTLTFEIGFCFLVWRPSTRWVILGMAVALHGGIGLFMGLKTFSLMMLTLVLAFVPPEVLHRWLRALAWGPTGLRLYFSGRSRRALRAASLVHALDIWNQIELVETGGRQSSSPGGAGKTTDEGLRLVTASGETVTGWALGFHLLGCLGIFRIFYPWNWLGARSRRRGGSADTAAPVPAVVSEPASRRAPPEPIKMGGHHVKPKP